MAKSPGPVIGSTAIKLIRAAVDRAFDKAKARVLGPWSVPKQIAVGYNREWSLPGIFEQAAKEEGYIPDLQTLKQLLDIAGGYIDATRERTKTRVVHQVTSFLKDAHMSGVKTDLPTVLGGALQDVMNESVVSMRRIIESETNNVKNVGILEGAIRVNATQGIKDPIVYFVSVNDESRCSECTRLHTIDGSTPRLWKLSEVGHGYHTKGDPAPKIGGLHPNCRCTMATLMPGYGFIGGRVTYITKDHDEYAKQA